MRGSGSDRRRRSVCKIVSRSVAMTYARELLGTHRRGPAIEAGVLVECIEACVDCAQSCTACADADLAEEDLPSLVRCVRTCLDCADVCEATGRVLSRTTEFDAQVGRAL